MTYICLHCNKEFDGINLPSFCDCGMMNIVPKKGRAKRKPIDPHKMQVLINRENDRIERDRNE